MHAGLVIGLIRLDTYVWRVVLAGAAGRHEMFYEARTPAAAAKMANDHVKGIVLHNVLGRLLS